MIPWIEGRVDGQDPGAARDLGGYSVQVRSANCGQPEHRVALQSRVAGHRWVRPPIISACAYLQARDARLARIVRACPRKPRLVAT
jgi:hypothetical protein